MAVLLLLQSHSTDAAEGKKPGVRKQISRLGRLLAAQDESIGELREKIETIEEQLGSLVQEVRDLATPGTSTTVQPPTTEYDIMKDIRW